MRRGPSLPGTRLPVRLACLVTLVGLALSTACAAGRHVDTSSLKDPTGFDSDGGVDLGTGCPNGVCASEACQEAKEAKTSVGCDYWAVDMDALHSANNGCFVTFVANTYSIPAHLEVSFAGAPIDLAQHAKIPQGNGKSLTYADFDPRVGIPAGQVAIVFLAGPPEGYKGTGNPVADPVRCPVPPAVTVGAQIHGTGMGHAFHVTTDMPVVAYQMLPYGGGMAAVTGATLLIPATAWDTNYIAANTYGPGAEVVRETDADGPSLDVVAAEDDTEVTILPKAAIKGGAIKGGPANVPLVFKLQKGETLQFTQSNELTGSPIQASKPVGVFGGHQCNNTPVSSPYCDHSEQQIPAVRALGNEYVGVPYRQRTAKSEAPPWRIVGAVDGTTLTFDPPVGGPTKIDQGEMVEFTTRTPFVVRSQDAEHPFLLLSYMTGATSAIADSTTQGYGDPDCVRVVPPSQYLKHYVFFTDPTYPETNLVVVRKRGKGGFADVTLDCAGKLGGFQTIPGNPGFEWTRVDLNRHDFQGQGACDTGRREMSSDEPFALTVWGWGGPETQPDGACNEHNPDYSCYVSYGYAAGEGLAPLNTVVLPPVPR